MIGRRLNARVNLAGAVSQRPKETPFDLNDFLDTREPFEVSLDWLGGSGSPDKRAYVQLAEQQVKQLAKRKQSLAFLGWAAIQAQKLTKAKEWPCTVVSDPVEPDNPSSDDHNPYHLVLKFPLDDPKQPRNAYHIASHLLHVFNKQGKPFLHPQLTPWQRVCRFVATPSAWFQRFRKPENKGGAKK